MQVANLLLEGGNPLEPRLAHQHGEEQVELGMLLHLGLHEDHAALGVQPCAEPVEHHVVDVGLEP